MAEKVSGDARGGPPPLRPQRRADALLALCSARIAKDPDPDRATVIVHAQLEGLRANSWGAETQDGAVLHPESVRRLLCNARIQTVIEDENANVIAIGPLHREPPVWMQRQVRYRDKECRFPGCGAKAYTEAHHVKFWSHGGRTKLENLLLICSFHHMLVHELRWRVTRSRDGTVTWFRPSGAEYSRLREVPEASRGRVDEDAHVALGELAVAHQLVDVAALVIGGAWPRVVVTVPSMTSWLKASACSSLNRCEPW